MTSFGLVYVAVNEDYRREAINSIKRAKEVMPDIDITLYSDNNPDINEIDKFRQISASTTIEHRLSRIDSLISTPYDRTLYLDSDTYICGDIKSIFDLLDRFDIAGLPIPFTRHDKNENEISGFESEIPVTYEWTNAGILLFKNTSRVRDLFSDWRNLYKKYASESYAMDQIYLREVLYESDCSVGALPNKYNCMPKYTGIIYDEPKIIHGAGLDVNLNKLEDIAEVFSKAYTATDSFGISYSGVRNVDKGKIHIQKHYPLYSHFSMDYPIPRKSTQAAKGMAYEINENGLYSGIEYILERLNRFLSN